MLRIDLRPGEAIAIGDAVVTLEDKSGKTARLSVQADRSIPVRRVEQEAPVMKRAAEQGITRKA